MTLRPTTGHRLLAVAALTPLVVLAGCGGDSDPEGAGSGEEVTEEVDVSFLVSNSESEVQTAEALAEAFNEEHPNITVTIETRPGGSEGDNIVKTRLATGDMTDIFLYNSGSLLQALNPEQTLTPLGDQEFAGRLDDAFVQSASSGDNLYGVPWRTAMGGGILYHIPTYEELGLEIPLTWEEFMENNRVIAEETDKAPVIQTYEETWTSQLFVLADFHNVLAEEPDFAEQYTANEAKYATSDAAIRGFEHLEQVHEEGLQNEDFASAGYADGVRMVATGEGVHYPMITQAIGEITANHPEQANDVGFFAQPGDDPDSNGLTVWSPHAVYLPQSTEGADRDAALMFMDFVASPAGCEAQTEALGQPSGPFAVEGCTLPDDVPQAVKDMQIYFDEGRTSPALEFLSPVKGPALEQITVEVGSGIRSAEDGAALYDEDVRKQAQQLGLEGW
ncbi:ABC transporter substrate-binding protein [Ornithinicoccus halotolerans]|uniref:ABC transporter substrate-binding protein n=1 Tax=Ornithinicoccus halotolerans TaxID=1748220 RepID=UPI001296DF07|nr:ABC transporter substrate-binding protein [Ornithinicoccus halotolerans]